MSASILPFLQSTLNWQNSKAVLIGGDRLLRQLLLDIYTLIMIIII